MFIATNSSQRAPRRKNGRGSRLISGDTLSATHEACPGARCGTQTWGEKLLREMGRSSFLRYNYFRDLSHSDQMALGQNEVRRRKPRGARLRGAGRRAHRDHRHRSCAVDVTTRHQRSRRRHWDRRRRRGATVVRGAAGIRGAGRRAHQDHRHRSCAVDVTTRHQRSRRRHWDRRRRRGATVVRGTRTRTGTGTGTGTGTKEQRCVTIPT